MNLGFQHRADRIDWRNPVSPPAPVAIEAVGTTFTGGTPVTVVDVAQLPGQERPRPARHAPLPRPRRAVGLPGPRRPAPPPSRRPPSRARHPTGTLGRAALAHPGELVAVSATAPTAAAVTAPRAARSAPPRRHRFLPPASHRLHRRRSRTAWAGVRVPRPGRHHPRRRTAAGPGSLRRPPVGLPPRPAARRTAPDRRHPGPHRRNDRRRGGPHRNGGGAAGHLGYGLLLPAAGSLPWRAAPGTRPTCGSGAAAARRDCRSRRAWSSSARSSGCARSSSARWAWHAVRAAGDRAPYAPSSSSR